MLLVTSRSSLIELRRRVFRCSNAATKLEELAAASECLD